MIGGGGQLCSRHTLKSALSVTVLQTSNFRDAVLAYTALLDDLCEVTSMSKSALHKHFKAMTSLMPLQYRTQLRLHEARRRL